MLQLKNATPFASTIMMVPDADGVDTLYCVVKGTFGLPSRPGDALAVADVQVPVVLADEHWGDPATSGIRRPSDFCLGKPGTDVVLLGSAHAPGGRPVTQMDVAIGVGPLVKWVRVFGDRFWDTSATDYRATAPAPFLTMPLVWERAFGGVDVTSGGPDAHPRNPSGVGHRVMRGTKETLGSPLPNVEDPSTLIGAWRDAPTPAGVAPVAPFWEPRRRYAGTYDETWQAQRAPYLPTDFDPRFFHLAPEGLFTAGHLAGGEPVELRGVTPAGTLQFELPRLQVGVEFRLRNGSQARFAPLDTVIFAPDEGRVSLVWRAGFACGKDPLQVREIHPRVVGA